ncbi:MAG: TonB-dependent receptor [Acidobacteria bacterium]|nr:TonB-dependent receptor [Thermoanaerobaculia bacterium]NLN11416.1 TonB-dependent receptor [Acidobacteriota bacterium]HPA95939.1 TonB-dependent receptor [Thermoanaerobaculia bacterium]HQN38825.1 TonB-dependent receptor [Thermoanaerobaculia bacterium]HRR12904.1 TonB-dependent receptor [Thermoanaerobaculia bacterium]
MQRRNAWIWALVLGLTLGGMAFGQGVQTGTLVGSVTSNDGSALPGVTVTVTSPSLQGERAAVSSVTGDYVMRGLPPGQYRVVFTLEGMKSVERQVSVGLGTTARADAVMEVAVQEETIVVTGEAPSALESTTVGANLTAEEVNALPISRTLSGIASFAPGLTTNTPNAGQVTISGGFAYDNVFLVDGVDVNDNLFGTANNLFIEDAIEETQVLTSGISAEYGRFSGGVINAITKSGGNNFSGSLRADFSKATWRDETPFEKERGIKREGDLSKFYSATLGGPIVRDALWFFLAGRDSEADIAANLPMTGLPYNRQDTNERYQGKLTATFAQNHTLQGTYTDNKTDQKNLPTFGFSIDPRTQYSRSLPNTGLSVSYSGIFTQSLFGEVRYSKKEFGFRNAGGTSTNIYDSPMISQGVVSPGGYHYNAPYFDATDPEDRNNDQYYGALSYFFSSESLGSHDVKFGYEQFKTTRTGGNSQSATNYVFDVDFLYAGGKVQYDSAGRIIPVFVPGYTGLEWWLADRGAKIDITTDSLFINDRWNLNKNWSFNIGFRYEQVKSKATGGITTVDTSAFVPRLGVSFDPLGNGKYKFDATYAQYAGKYSEAQFAEITTVGNPKLLYGYYIGPEGQGLDFAPGFNPSNYFFYYANDPTANVFSDPDINSPVTREYTLAAGMDLGRGGFLKLIYTDRDVSDFVEDFVTMAGGQTHVVVGGIDAGMFDNRWFRNSNQPERKYQALQLQGRYRITDKWAVNLGWTYQIKNDGNFEGEGANTPGISSIFGDYPEIYSPAYDRYFTKGRLNDYQKNKVRLWTNYLLDFGRAGAFDLGLVWRYDSATTFSYAAANVPIPAQLRANDPGYASPPRNATLFFGKRGAGFYNSTSLFDASVTYRIPIWKTVEPYVKFEVYNVLNDDKLVTFNTTITADAASPKDANGLPTGYKKGASFGKATSAGNYVTPREYFIAAGIRF